MVLVNNPAMLPLVLFLDSVMLFCLLASDFSWFGSQLITLGVLALSQRKLFYDLRPSIYSMTVMTNWIYHQ